MLTDAMFLFRFKVSDEIPHIDTLENYALENGKMVIESVQKSLKGLDFYPIMLLSILLIIVIDFDVLLPPWDIISPLIVVK